MFWKCPFSGVVQVVFDEPQEGEIHFSVGKFVLGGSVCTLKCRAYSEETVHCAKSFIKQIETLLNDRTEEKGKKYFKVARMESFRQMI